jgi:hypothetical protein
MTCNSDGENRSKGENRPGSVLKFLTNIILANMNTFTTNSDCHIDSIVDEERYIVGLGDFVQLFGFTYQLSSIACLFTILDDGHTWMW